MTWVLGIIGGSGLYEMEGLEKRSSHEVSTPWGAPSGRLTSGELDGVRVVFLPRHGLDHRTPPGDINARANICALKQMGCTDVLSLSAVGSLREEMSPGSFVVVDQYIDRTVGRPASFFGEGCVAHVSLARPVCPRLSSMAAEAARQAGAARVFDRGCYLAMEGPQFSTKAESELYRMWGCDVIGMTNMPEARLAREAQLPYASVAMVTDYDCWRDDIAPVEVDHVLAHSAANARTARALVRHLALAMKAERPPSPIDTCLRGAIVTPAHARDPELVRRLSFIAGELP